MAESIARTMPLINLGHTMLKKSYAGWMYRWETKLTTRDENRVVRPLEWGFEWIEPFLSEHGLGSDYGLGLADLRQAETAGPAAAEAAMMRINEILIKHSDEFFGYQRPA